jgi:Tfp pilus assembly protein PilF
MKAIGFALAMAWVLLSGSQAAEQEGEPRQQAEARARALLAHGQGAQAIPLLKAEIERDPASESLRLLLARAYLDDSNDFWALRTVAAAAELHPEDCNLRLWLAWIQIRQGALEQARTLLDGACSHWQPEKARRALLLAMLEQQAGSQAEAQARLDEARGADLVYPEDRAAISQLEDDLEPGYLPPVSGRLDLNLGWAANARAGSPADLTTAGKSESSALAQTAVWLRFVMPGRSWVRPSLEADVRALGYSAAAGRDFSYLMLGGRPGVLLGRGNRRVLLAYHYESLLLAGGDQYQGGPLWFYDSHRGEMEIEVFSGLTVFGGVGKRNFREMGRSRLEADGGIGGGFEAGSRLRVLGALSGRYYDAKNDAYDLRGASLLIATDVRLPRRWSMRAGFLGSYDSYPRWDGYLNLLVRERDDRLLKLSASAFLPPLRDQLKIGFTYEFSNRDSTAQPFAYTDHRLLAKLIWTFTADPWLPAAASPSDHVALNYGLHSRELTERVQDLLRQDEAMQRSSSCRE